MNEGKELVLKTLHQACSQDPNVLKGAEKVLGEWESEPGFYLTLTQVFSDYTNEVTVRLLAVLYLKNGVHRSWRKGALNVIVEEEKKNIKHLLLLNVREPAPQIATQLAVVVGEIARLDFPDDWPELIPALYSGIRLEEDIVRQRTLLCLHHVIKQLSTKTLPYHRRIFQELTTNIFEFLCNFWENETKMFLNAAVSEGPSSPTMMTSLERSHLSLKVLRKLVVYGFKKPHENKVVTNFIHTNFDIIKTMVDFRKRLENYENIRIISEKYIILLTKVLYDLLQMHPLSYINFIKSSLDLTFYYMFSLPDDSLLFERFIIKGFNLMKAIIHCPEYKPQKNSIDDYDYCNSQTPEIMEVQKIKTSFFTEHILLTMFRKLISHYFLMNQEELTFWDSDPEEYFLDKDGGESWKYEIKSCTETFFLTLFTSYRKTLTPALVELVHLSQNPVNPQDGQGILQKDAIYKAVGLASFELFDEIDFDSLFTNLLVNEAKVKVSNYRILRRRVIWLIGQWTGVNFATGNSPILYELLINLMTQDEDMVVRLTAAEALQNSMSVYLFQTDHFLPFVGKLFSLVFSLLQEVRECDTKMSVLHVLSCMIEVVGNDGEKNAPFFEPLAHYLPTLWDESSDYKLNQCAIITTLTHMVAALRTKSESLHPFLFKVIKFATDVNHDAHIYLQEDGLNLWFATIENCTQISPLMLNLYENILPIIEMSSEYLELCLQITNSYTILCPQMFLSQFGMKIIEGFLSIMNDLKEEGLIIIFRSLEVMLFTLPQEACVLLKPVLPGLVHSFTESDVSMFSEQLSLYISILARLILTASDVFFWTLTKAGEEVSKSFEDILSAILNVWTTRFSHITSIKRRKLVALGLAKICSTPLPQIVKVWPAAVTCISEVIFDITSEEGEDTLLWNDYSAVLNEDDQNERRDGEDLTAAQTRTEGDKREWALASQDQVHTISLKSFLGQQLLIFQSSCDNEIARNLYENLQDDCKELVSEITTNLQS